MPAPSVKFDLHTPFLTTTIFFQFTKNMNSASSADGMGNTIPYNRKQISPSKVWCFTWNNFSSSDPEILVGALRQVEAEYVFQHEVGASGTPHLQGFVHFKKKVRPLAVFPEKRIHWEKCRDKPPYNAAIAYACKVDTRAGDIWRNINLPLTDEERAEQYSILKPEELTPWMYMILDIIKEKADKRTIHWFFEESGRMNKTAFQRYCMWHLRDEVMILGGKATDMLNGICQLQKAGKKMPSVILINLPRVCDHISYSGLEQLKDGLFFSPKFEGGCIFMPHPHIFVFANSVPDITKMSMDRWRLYHISTQDGCDTIGGCCVHDGHPERDMYRSRCQHVRGVVNVPPAGEV